MKKQTDSGYLAVSILALGLCAYSFAQSGATTPQTAEQTTAASQQSADKKAASQETPGTVYKSPAVLKANSRLVIVDVVATNKNDEPITDLQPKDFTVLEDGKPQQVRSFSFQQPVAVDVKPGAKPTPRRPLPANVVTNIPEYKSEGSLNVVLLDSVNTMTLDQITARDQALKVLEQLPPGRATAVYALSDKLHALHDFTTDLDELKNAVTGFAIQNSVFLNNPTNGPEIEYVHPSLKYTADIAAENWTESRSLFTLDALNSLARALAGYPGRKNLIWISAGFPMMLNPVDRNFSAAVERTANLLSNSQIAVYPVDARGAATSKALQAQNGKGGYTGPGLMAKLSQEAAELLNAHNTMNALAEMTGGRAFYNRNELGKAIAKCMDDGSTYYTLGYYPVNKKWNGKFRKITLELDRPDIKLRYRTGYLAEDSTSYQKQSDKQHAQDLGQALSLDFPISTALMFQAGILPSSAKTHNKIVVNYLLDAHQIGFEREDDGFQHATLDYAIQVYSEKGEALKTDVTSIETAFPADAFNQVMKTGFLYQKTLNLPPGNYILRLGIRDSRTGLIGTGTGRITMAAQTANQNHAPQR
jgi:VWFA-related protein